MEEIYKDINGIVIGIGDTIQIMKTGEGASSKDVRKICKVKALGKFKSSKFGGYTVELDIKKHGNNDPYIGPGTIKVIEKARKVNIKIKLPSNGVQEV